MSKITLSLLSSLLWFVPASFGADGSTERILILKPKQVHEEGIALERGQRAVYSTRASQPLQFNIHFHEGESVTYVRADAPTGETDATLTSNAKREYWFMWTNDTDEPVALYFKIRREPKRL